MAKENYGFAINKGTDSDKGYALFSAKIKMPMIDDPASTPEKPLPQIPKYKTEQEHVSEWLWGEYKRACNHGRDVLKIQAASVLDGDIQDLKQDLD